MNFFASIFGGGTAVPPPVACPVDPITGEILESPEIRAQGLLDLRLRMDECKIKDGIRYPREDEQFLLAFLRARKYKIADALHVINNFAKVGRSTYHC